jgi:membrane protein
MARTLDRFRLALMTSFSHDVFGTAKAAAYSAILCLFPTLLVFTTLLALTPESDTVRGEMRAAFAEVLPADTMTLLHDYFNNQKVRGVQVVSSAIVVSLIAAMGMMLSLMGGFRRAYDLPRHEWNFWVERGVALALVPLCLVPMSLATVLVAFGHQIEQWVVSNSYHVLGPLVLFVWRMVRWTIGLFTTIVMLAVIYQFGTPRRREWKFVLYRHRERAAGRRVQCASLSQNAASAVRARASGRGEDGDRREERPKVEH